MNIRSARLTRIARVSFLCIAAVACASAIAQDYPTKPITLVVPFPPGGATDTIGRQIGKTLGDRLGQTVIIENKPGAGTMVGAGAVARSAPDGYTLLISSGTTFTVNPAIYPKVPYDTVKSFEPIGLIGRSPMVILANADVPINNFKELVAAAKAAPDKYAYGSYGNGTTAHFAGEMIQQAAGIKLRHLPYKGSAPAMNDLMGGHIPFTVDTLTAALPQLKSGKVKAIAVTTAQRSPMAPDIPSVAESGYPGVNADTWIAIVSPRGLPPAVRTRLVKALADSVASEETRSKLSAIGTEPAYGTPDELAKLIATEMPVMKEIAQRASIKLD
jgi:tripartite-type tricarboxylate transporter receptor subunit TctC